jgi:hypothetical protein
MPRRKIHTAVKALAFLNTLPLSYQDQIHRSQLNRYKQTNPTEYFGAELSEIMSKELQWIRQFGDFPMAKRLSIGILKLFIFFRATVSKCKGFNTALRKEKHLR